MREFEKTPRNVVHRKPLRAHYDKATIYQIIDEALFCHVGFAREGQPYVIPTIHARLGDNLVFHGATASRLLDQIQSGAEICVAITLLDALVLAPSVCSHSMNYRSVVLFGKGRLITDDQEKMRALELLTDHLLPGRWCDARRPTQKELDATTVVSLSIESASAKIRTGPPMDDEEDYQLPVWAGLLPIRQQFLDAVNDPKLREGIPVPDYVVNSPRRRPTPPAG